jgi:translation initiation factor eIF-2B subunit gamma
LNAALSTNPYLTALPAPKATILCPSTVTQNTGTAEILRLPEVRAIVEEDFIILPCDLVCDVQGEALLETWMVKEGGLGGLDGSREKKITAHQKVAGAAEGRRGGLGVWYPTNGLDAVKGEETDFVATTPPVKSTVAPDPRSLLPHVSNLVYAAPTDSVKDIIEDKSVFPVRHSLVRKHGNVKFRTSYRDAHLYFFPYWILDVVARNERLVSISEDVVGWWAKAGWQEGLGKKLGFDEVLKGRPQSMEDSQHDGLLENDVDLFSMSSTATSRRPKTDTQPSDQTHYASRVRMQSKGIQPTTPNLKDRVTRATDLPPILAYIHPKVPESALVRRVDTVPLLLSISLRLAKLPGLDETDQTASSFAHPTKIAYPAGINRPATVTKGDCLLADNVTIEERAVVKECVVGMGCRIEKGARLTRCLLMEGAIVSEQCQLTGCVLGRRCNIGKLSTLKDCEVQDGYLVPESSK